MESDTNREKEEKELKQLYKKFPFLHYLKSRLICYVDRETGRRFTGHVAMFYRDTKRIRIDWDNGATTFHDFTDDSVWLFKSVKRKT